MILLSFLLSKRGYLEIILKYSFVKCFYIRVHSFLRMIFTFSSATFVYCLFLAFIKCHPHTDTKCNFCVFVSFRGKNRLNFFLNRLYLRRHRYCQQSIQTFAQEPFSGEMFVFISGLVWVLFSWPEVPFFLHLRPISCTMELNAKTNFLGKEWKRLTKSVFLTDYSFPCQSFARFFYQTISAGVCGNGVGG